MRKISLKLSAASCALALMLVCGTPVAFAESGSSGSGSHDSSGSDDTTPSDSSGSSTSGERETEVETHNSTTVADATDVSSEHSAKLNSVKLRVCENHQKNINKIMDNSAERGQHRLDLFTTIATRVEKFYTDKGKTLSNYDALVADVNAKQTAAQTAVDALKSASTSGFSCNDSNPKGTVSSFRAALKAEISALKNYRTAVRNLIVGVKSVTGTTQSGSTANQTSGGGSQ